MDLIRDREIVGFTAHARERMRQRGIGAWDIEMALRDCRIVESYPDDAPHPGVLVLGFASGRPLHVAVEERDGGRSLYVRTAYEPDGERWYPDFLRRRRR